MFEDLKQPIFDVKDNRDTLGFDQSAKAGVNNYFENYSNICLERTKDNSNKLDKNNSQLSDDSCFKVPKCIVKGKRLDIMPQHLKNGLSGKYLGMILNH